MPASVAEMLRVMKPDGEIRLAPCRKLLTSGSAKDLSHCGFEVTYEEKEKGGPIAIIRAGENIKDDPVLKGLSLEIFKKLVGVEDKVGSTGRSKKSKAEIILLGKHLNVAFEHTWSCYRGEEKACGHCDSCTLRLKGFQEAEMKDPLHYQTYPQWYNTKP